MMEDVVEYQCLLPHQFEERMEGCPLVYVPVGALEWHGEHLALGNDTLKIHALCCEAARRGGGIVFPPIYYGVPEIVPYGADYQFKANVPVTEAFLRNLLNTTLRALEKVGFKAAILITGHTSDEQSRLMRDIAANYDGEMIVYGTDDMEWADDIGFTSDHAAKWETSILWYVRPELVDIFRLSKDLGEKPEGVWGDDPRVYASRELGKRAVEAIARDLARLGADLLTRGAPGNTTGD
jgi:creatinine amidohydrolase